MFAMRPEVTTARATFRTEATEFLIISCVTQLHWSGLPGNGLSSSGQSLLELFGIFSRPEFLQIFCGQRLNESLPRVGDVFIKAYAKAVTVRVAEDINIVVVAKKITLFLPSTTFWTSRCEKPGALNVIELVTPVCE